MRRPGHGAQPHVRKPAPQRYEHENAGNLVHADIKKLGRIPDGGGHRALGRAKGRRNRRAGTGGGLQRSSQRVMSLSVVKAV